jgi:Mn2+/Fe2+ NRAMP family transporter
VSDRSFFKALGPGLLFAGAAIGVSHLVQSTRAGATYGLGLILFVLVANISKYPAFSFGPRYAAATGTSLLEGYRRQGTWALVLYAVLTAGTMFTVQAAVTAVTAGLFITLWPVEILPVSVGSTTITPLVSVSTGAIALCSLLLVFGGYRWLDRIMKVVVVVLTVTTVAATALSLPQLDAGSLVPWPAADDWNLKTAFFVAGLMGWMPTAIDISVWHSLWTLARSRDSGHTPTVREAMLDFNIGYIGTAGLAFCFLVMGAAVMHDSGIQFQDSAAAFAGQIIGLYTSTLGGWAGPLVSVAAFSVMFSTTLTVVDGFARAIAALVARFGSPETAETAEGDRRVYWLALAVLGLGSVAILHSYVSGLKGLVDLATTISFLTAPVLAWLNHRAILSDAVAQADRPSAALQRFSAVSIAFLAVLAVGWLVLRFGFA